MSMDNQISQRGRGSRLRIVIAAAVAALLLGSSFYAAQAGNNSGYDDSLNGLEVAAIAVGGVGAGIVILGIMNDDDDDEDESSSAKSKNAKAGNVEQVRVRSLRNELSSGDATSVEVEARYQGSKTWKNVTDSANLSLVKGSLTQIDGTKNTFAVPYGSKVAPGSATIQASFGGQSASTTVAVN
jgi:hypothetical protein